MAHVKTKRKSKNKKKIICIVVLVISLLLLIADLGFYAVTNRMASQLQNFTSFSAGSFPGMNFGEDSTESTGENMPSLMPSMPSQGSDEDASDSGKPSMSSGENGETGSDSGKPSMPSGENGETGSDSGKPSMPSGENGETGSDSGMPSMPSGSQNGNTGSSSQTGGSNQGSGTNDDSSSSADSVSGNMSMPSGVTMPSMNSGVTAGLSRLIAIRKFCIPAAIILALIVLLCIFLLIRIRKEEKKRRTRLLSGTDGDKEIYGEDGRLLTEEEAEARAARMAVEESIAKRSKAKRRNAILAFLLVILLILLAVGSRYIRSENLAENTSIEKETISGTVEKGTLNTTLQGYGTLAAEEASDVTIPGSVTVVSYAVSNGDTVEAGDLIATVDKTTVLSSIAELQTLMDQLDAELDEVSDETISDEVTAAADGRIMAVYAEEGTSVVDTMYGNQALMIISLDGLLAIDFTTDQAYTVGTSLTVETADGDTYSGRVANIDNNTVTVTVTDDGPQMNEAVTLKDSNGNVITSGTLYVHSPLKVTGFAGTVSEIEVEAGDQVEAGDTLLTLTDTDYSANYDSMIQQREVLENQMAVLMRAYMTGGVYAEQKGVISGINDTATEDNTASDTVSDAEGGTAGDTVSEAAGGMAGNTVSEAAGGTTGNTVFEAAGGMAGNTVSEAAGGTTGDTVSEAAGGMTADTASASDISRTGSLYGAGSGTQTIYVITVASAGETTVESSLSDGVVSESGNSGNSSENGEGTGETSGSSGDSKSTEGNSSYSEESGTAGGNNSDTTGQDTGDSTSGDNTGATESAESSGSSSDTTQTTSLTAEQIAELVEWLSKLDSATLNQILSQLDYSILKPIYDAMTGYKSSHASADGDSTGGISPGEGSGTGEDGTPDGEGTAAGGGTLPSGGTTGTDSSTSGTDISSLIGSLTGGTGSSGVSSANISASAASSILNSSEAAAIEGAEEEETKTFTFSETQLCTLTPDDIMTIDITVDEMDILSVLVNTGVQVTLDAFEGQSFEGTISYIDTDGSNSGGDTKYTVTVTIDRTEDMLAGMNANVSMTLSTKEDVLTVPAAALAEESGNVYVYTGYDEKKKELTDPVEVTTGISDGTNVEILEGLDEGDSYYYQYAGTIIYNFVSQ